MARSFLRSILHQSTATPVSSLLCNLRSKIVPHLYEVDKKISSSTLNESKDGDKCCNNPYFVESSVMHLSPLLQGSIDSLKGLDVEVIDLETWQVSSSIAHAWQLNNEMARQAALKEGMIEKAADSFLYPEADPDFDEIEDLRIRGNLFYKLDRDSREYEEYNINFFRKRSLKKNGKVKEGSARKETKGKKNCNPSSSSSEKIHVKGNGRATKNLKHSQAEVVCSNIAIPSIEVAKKRTPTYNQLTDPYHLPFCLDIFISKGSVRACIIHRVTSKVVAVAHSISKDLKYELVSTKDSTACAAVGRVLAQRAIADDIYNIIYSPRKGEKLEGKLQIVLQSIIDNGIDVRVKIKQRRANKIHTPSVK